MHQNLQHKAKALINGREMPRKPKIKGMTQDPLGFSLTLRKCNGEKNRRQSRHREESSLDYSSPIGRYQTNKVSWHRNRGVGKNWNKDLQKVQ